MSFISLRGSPDYFAYNNRTTPFFYSALWKLCCHSDSMRDAVVENSNFTWCLRFLYFESAEYPTVSGLMEKFFTLVINDPALHVQWIVNLTGWANRSFASNPLRFLQYVETNFFYSLSQGIHLSDDE